MEETFYDEGLLQGRMIAFSKSAYRENYPENLVVFNANVFVLGEGKIWYGDLDITLEEKKLKKIANKLGKDLFILYEYDGRFENEILPDPEIIKRACYKISK